MKLIRTLAATAVAAVMGMTAFSAHASLTSFRTFSGNVAVSTDGWGSTTQAGQISAFVPVGATVLGAYLYTSTFNSLAGAGGTFQGNVVNYTSLGVNAGFLAAGRVDVTSIVKPIVDGGAGGTYNFNITENSVGQDGSALVVVYELGSLGVSTVAILDGFSATTGDTTTVNFAEPLNPAAPGFQAEMRLGIGFSFDGSPCGSQTQQTSRVSVNSTVITNSAGCNDDSVDASPGNGNLITVGGDDDALSPNLPTILQDKERYNLVPRINAGDTSIRIDTLNPSNDDNIFLAVFKVSGLAGFNEPPPTVPEPMSLALVGMALAGLGLQRRKAKRA